MLELQENIYCKFIDQIHYIINVGNGGAVTSVTSP